MVDPVSSLKKVVDALECLGIPYVIGGSHASSVHGAPRATNHVDIVAAIQAEQAEALASELGPGFYADPTMIRDALVAGRAFNVIDYSSTYKFDIFPAADPFSNSQIARSETARTALPGEEPVECRIASAEDVVLAKLSWYKRGGQVSEQQWRDILGVLRVSGSRLDAAYLRDWAERLGVSELLDRARAEA